MTAETKCTHGGTSLRPNSSTPRNAASRKNARQRLVAHQRRRRSPRSAPSSGSSWCRTGTASRCPRPRPCRTTPRRCGSRTPRGAGRPAAASRRNSPSSTAMYEASPMVNAGSRKWNAIRNANWMRDRRTGSMCSARLPLRCKRLRGWHCCPRSRASYARRHRLIWPLGPPFNPPAAPGRCERHPGSCPLRQGRGGSCCLRCVRLPANRPLLPPSGPGR